MLERNRLDRRAVLAALGGCALGAPVLAASSQRIVSVGGALTETLFELGAQRELVGVDTTSNFPQAVRALPNVGYARSLSAEGVLALKPSMIVATEDAGPPAVLRQLQALQVALHVLDARHSFEGAVARSERLAELTGRRAEGRQLVERLQAQWARRPRDAGRAPRALFVLAHNPASVMVGGTDTAADAMLGYAGAVNAFGGVRGFKPLTPEAALAAAPEVLLFTAQGLEAAGGVDGALRLPGLALTPAGRARRVVSMEAMLMLGFGPRLPQAVGELHTLLRSGAAA